jgi:hypothetical protein
MRFPTRGKESKTGKIMVSTEVSMTSSGATVNRQSFAQVYMWSLVTAGALIVVFSIFSFPFQELNSQFGVLCIMVVASSLVAIRIPRVSGRITVADTFV